MLVVLARIARRAWRGLDDEGLAAGDRGPPDPARGNAGDHSARELLADPRMLVEIRATGNDLPHDVVRECFGALRVAASGSQLPFRLPLPIESVASRSAVPFSRTSSRGRPDSLAHIQLFLKRVLDTDSWSG